MDRESFFQRYYNSEMDKYTVPGGVIIYEVIVGAADLELERALKRAPNEKDIWLMRTVPV